MLPSSFLKVSYLEPTLTKFFLIVPRNGDCSRQWVKRKPPQNPTNVPPPREGGGGVGNPPTQNFQDTPPVASADH